MAEILIPLEDIGLPATQPQLWLAEPDGTGVRKIFDGDLNGPLSPKRHNLDAVWAQDGSVIHITEYPDLCVPHLYDMSPTGGVPVARSVATNKDMQFVWSPDDSQIAYFHFTSEDFICEQNGSEVMTHSLMVMNADGSGPRVVKANAWYEVTAWWPDGSALMAINPDTKRWYKVSLADGSASYLGVVGTYAEVSPNGAYIAYVHSGSLHVKTVEGGSDRNLGAQQPFAWSPTGSSLAVGGAQIWLVNPATGIGKVVYSGAASELTWSPDGTQIAFLHALGSGRVEIKVLIPKVGTIVTIPGVSSAISLDWEP
jgi:Tol biopolymer transport system component